MKHQRRFIFLLTISLFFIFTSILKINVKAEDTIQKSSNQFYYFDTYITLTLYSDETVPQEDWDALDQAMEYIEFTFSRTDPRSELFKLNQKAGLGPVEVSDDLFKVIKTALQYANLTKGKFDPTIGPLVEIWGITTDSPKVPTEEEIQQTLELVDYNLLTINETNKTVELEKEGMIIDLGAIAKGYAADYVAEKVKELGYEHAILNLGGNILTIGERPQKNAYNNQYEWGIGITKPKEIDLNNPYDIIPTEIMANVFVIDKTVVISGTYERFWVDNGKFYHHILDPDTGYPSGKSVDQFEEDDLSSVVIVTDSSIIADALSTSLFALGLDEARKFVEELDNVEAIFTTYGKDIYYSSNFKNLYDIQILINEFNTPAIEEPTGNNYIIPISIGMGVLLVSSITLFVIKKYRK